MGERIVVAPRPRAPPATSPLDAAERRLRERRQRRPWLRAEVEPHLVRLARRRAKLRVDRRREGSAVADDDVARRSGEPLDDAGDAHRDDDAARPAPAASRPLRRRAPRAAASRGPQAALASVTWRARILRRSLPREHEANVDPVSRRRDGRAVDADPVREVAPERPPRRTTPGKAMPASAPRSMRRGGGTSSSETTRDPGGTAADRRGPSVRARLVELDAAEVAVRGLHRRDERDEGRPHAELEPSRPRARRRQGPRPHRDPSARRARRDPGRPPTRGARRRGAGRRSGRGRAP